MVGAFSSEVPGFLCVLQIYYYYCNNNIIIIVIVLVCLEDLPVQLHSRIVCHVLTCTLLELPLNQLLTN